MVGFNVVRGQPPHGVDQHRAFGRQHSRPRPVSTTRGLSKTVVQITLIKGRGRFDFASLFIDPEQREPLARQQNR